MSAAALLERLAVAGVKLTALGADKLAAEPAAALTDNERERLTSWLDRIGETDPAIRAHMLAQCTRDPEARKDYLAQAVPVVRLHLVIEDEASARAEALLEVPSERFDGERALEAFERHRMADSTWVVEVRHEAQDDRHYCRDCSNLRGKRCLAAARGALLPSTGRDYAPLDDVPRRCEAFRKREK